MKGTTESKAAILQALRADARMSYSEVARRAGVERRQVAQIVADAVQAGEVRLTATVSPTLLGQHRFAYLLLDVDGPTASVITALERLPEVCFLSSVTGPYPVDAELRVGTRDELEQVIDGIRSLPGVRRVVTFPYSQILINIDSPISRRKSDAPRVDRVDRAIVQVLEQDARATYRELAEAAGISPAGARNRLARLVAEGSVKLVALAERRKTTGPPRVGLGIRARRTVAAAAAQLREENPEFLATTSGQFDLIMTLSAETSPLLQAKLEHIRGLSEISGVESWFHLQTVKENYRMQAHA